MQHIAMVEVFEEAKGQPYHRGPHKDVPGFARFRMKHVWREDCEEGDESYELERDDSEKFGERDAMFPRFGFGHLVVREDQEPDINSRDRVRRGRSSV